MSIHQLANPWIESPPFAVLEPSVFNAAIHTVLRQQVYTAYLMYFILKHLRLQYNVGRQTLNLCHRFRLPAERQLLNHLYSLQCPVVRQVPGCIYPRFLLSKWPHSQCCLRPMLR